MNQAAIATIFRKNRKEILLIKRRDIPVWVLPGGGIDQEETPENACIRETLEETGYKIKIIRKVGEYLPYNRLTKRTHVYEGIILEGEAKCSEETAQVAFFSVDRLPYFLPPPYDTWIQEAHKNLPLIKRKLTEITYLRLCKAYVKHPVLVTKFLMNKWSIIFGKKSS